MKIIKVCATCGCEKVCRVQYSDWDIDTQRWEPLVICVDCRRERKTIDKPFETSGEVDSGMYDLIVRFTRSKSDDEGVTFSKYGEFTKATATKQLAEELQEAYDELGISGSFQVESVEGLDK